jgi:dihydrolipoamide dehydrogenase
MEENIMAEHSTKKTDVLVIGAGPGGYVSAIRAAQLGQKVIIVDKSNLGGVCLNRGCIPSKALISAAEKYEIVKHSSNEIGISAKEVEIDFSKLQEWKQSIVNKLTSGVESLLKGNKIEILKGQASFVNQHEIEIKNKDNVVNVHFKYCVIATGSRPIELPTFPFEGRVISSTEALQLKEIPKSMVVIGGGYIGIELSQAYAKLGTQITIIEGTKSILPGFEPRLISMVKRNLKNTNVVVHTNAMAKQANQGANDVKVSFQVKEEEQEITADYVLVTVGRRPNTESLNLQDIEMVMGEKGLIKVDSQCRTSIPHIYAIGDIVPGPGLAHKASYEGKIAAEAIVGKGSKVNYRAIPAVVFSDPEIATVGITEKEAKEQGYETTVGRFSYAANGRALALQASEGSVTLVGDKKTGAILGGQIVGLEASDLIAEIGLAIEAEMKLDQIASTIHAHPTMGEIVMEAAEGALGHGIHSL